MDDEMEVPQVSQVCHARPIWTLRDKNRAPHLVNNTRTSYKLQLKRKTEWIVESTHSEIIGSPQGNFFSLLVCLIISIFGCVTILQGLARQCRIHVLSRTVQLPFVVNTSFPLHALRCFSWYFYLLLLTLYVSLRILDSTFCTYSFSRFFKTSCA